MKKSKLKKKLRELQLEMEVQGMYQYLDNINVYGRMEWIHHNQDIVGPVYLEEGTDMSCQIIIEKRIGDDRGIDLGVCPSDIYSVIDFFKLLEIETDLL